MDNNLPKGWTIVSPLEVADKIRGVSYGKEDVSSESKPGFIPVLRANGIEDNKLTYDDIVYVRASKIGDNQILLDGDVVIAMSSGSKNLVGKTAQFFGEQEVSFGAFCGVLRPNPEMNSKYFGYYFQTKNYRNIISDVAAGTNINNLRNEHFESLKIPIPPLAEQQRIVAKLAEFMERIDRSRARLDRIPKILKRFRQSILSAAVSGKLTEEWRGTNKVTEANIQSDLEVDENGWLIMKASEACHEVASGSTPPNNPFTKEGEIPFLKVYNIVDQKIDFDYKPQFVSREIHETKLKRCKLYPNDVIINIVGPPLGKVALVTNQYPEWNMNQALVLFRPKEFLLPIYTFYILNEGSEIKRLENEYRGSAGQTNISLTQCRNFVFSIPPIAEQREIVRKVEQLFAIADKIEARYNKAKAQVDRLPQSLLAKAFLGELVPQDENDEPASILIEKLRAQKLSPTESKKVKKKLIEPNNTIMEKKMKLQDLIESKFNNKRFSFEELHKELQIDYEITKQELFSLLSTKFLEMSFDEKKEVMVFKRTVK